MGFKDTLGILLVGLGLVACAPSGKALKSIEGSVFDLAENSPFKIINGKDVEPTDEFAASIVGIFNYENNSLCTGSIISESYVLTAAHCVAKEPKNLRVFFGSSMDTIVAINPVIAAATPQFYGARFEESTDWGDIALLKMDGGLPKGYKPIPLMTFDVLQVGQPTVIAGYGLSDGITKEGSGILRKTSVPIANPSHGLSEASLDQRQGTGACHGDSGGPAYILTESGYSLWGVTSRGLNDLSDQCTQFAVYTKAVYYQDWITKTRLDMLGL